jgi:hypothetical protein
MATVDTRAGSVLQSHGLWGIYVLAALQAVIGVLILFPGRGRKLAVGAGIIVSLLFWVVGQSLGSYYTGLATDPNSAPLFILLGVAILGCVPLGARRLWRQTAQGVEQAIT